MNQSIAPALWQGHLNGTAGAAKELRRLAAKRLADRKCLILATNRQDARQALNDCCRRWGIECLFGNAKTRGEFGADAKGHGSTSGSRFCKPLCNQAPATKYYDKLNGLRRNSEPILRAKSTDTRLAQVYLQW